MQKSMRNTHSQITIALEHIITKCGQTLYEGYLNQKLPNDCNQRVVGSIQAGFNAMVTKQPVKNRIKREAMPRPASVDTIMPMKVRVREWDASEGKKSVQPKFFNTQLPSSSEKLLKRDDIKSARPNFCFKYSCAKGEIDLNEQKVRREKLMSDRQQLKSATESHRSQYNTKAKRKNLQAKIKQLTVEGVPYAFDDEGNLIAPDIKSYKKDMQIQNKKAQAKPFTLRFKALEVLSGESEMMTHSKLLGRKKGYASINSERKKKINDEQFNNQNQRQCSTIPFMDIQSGIKVVERQRNIMAEKLRQPQPTRQEYQTESKKSLFKSYMPISEYQGVSRPATHSHNRNSRSVGLSSGNLSIHSRPKTSRQNNRVNINNKQLAIQLFKDDDALRRRFM